MSSPIQKAAANLGGAAALAKVAGVSVAAAHQWINGERPVPATRAPVIAKASGVPVEDLCPTVPWALVREPDDKPDAQRDRRSGTDRRKRP